MSPFFEVYMQKYDIIKRLKGHTLDLKSLEEKSFLVSDEEKEALKNILNTLIDEGIVYFKDGSYSLLSDLKIYLGEVIEKANNYVLIRVKNSSLEIRLSGKESDDLLVGDLIYLREFQDGIYHALEYYKAISELKGTFSLSSRGEKILLVPSLKDTDYLVFVDNDTIGVKQGDLVKAKIIRMRGNKIFVSISERLVDASSVSSDISKILYLHDVESEFSQASLEECEKIEDKITAEELQGREDYRDHLVFTIDSDEAHDFDDAIEGKRVGAGYEVVVHIADVTHYVKRNHPLDEEASKRGTSIYLADRVVPMLPVKLSNGICSLNPNVDRLTLSCKFNIDANGNAFNSSVFLSVINSKARLTYNNVNKLFANEEVDIPKDIADSLKILNECAKTIRKRRELNGALSLESTELKFRLDENGNPVEVIKEIQGEAEKLIEDLMIVANCEVAKLLKRARIPLLYRVHDLPPKDKLEKFKDYLKKIGLLTFFPKDSDITSSRLNDFLANIKDPNLRLAVSSSLLRALAKAKYSPMEIGHFGLSELYYCHFTSPIRRYPDDIIHRLVKEYLLEEKNYDKSELKDYLDYEGERLSSLEVRADEIEREVDDLESCKYMLDKIGTTFDAKVTSLLKRGMFVETSLGIEGFISYRLLEGDYFFNERKYVACSENDDKVYSLGTPLKVTLLYVDVENRDIDFISPSLYKKYSLSIDDEEKRRLAKEGIRIYQTEKKKMVGKPRFINRRNSHRKNYNKKNSYRGRKR